MRVASRFLDRCRWSATRAIDLHRDRMRTSRSSSSFASRRDREAIGA
jgi:hypothetical protein